MLEMLIFVALASVVVNEVADVPKDGSRKTLVEAIDCSSEKDDWIAACVFPEEVAREVKK